MNQYKIINNVFNCPPYVTFRSYYQFNPISELALGIVCPSSVNNAELCLDALATCQNVVTEGASNYQCTCNTGYTDKGGTCVIIGNDLLLGITHLVQCFQGLYNFSLPEREA